MLDINLFREEKGGNPEIVRESQRKRFARVELVDEVIEKDKEWRKVRFDLTEMKTQYKSNSKLVAQKKKNKEDADDIIAKNKELDGVIKDMEKKEAQVLEERDRALHQIGNLIHESVPVSNDEENNAIVRTFGEPAQDGERFKYNHVDLTILTGIADTERGAAVAGNRGYFLQGAGVLLNQALINYGLGFLVKKGYSPLQTPFFMKQSVMAECAQLEQFDEELYKVTGEGDDKYLIATSEQPTAAFHRKEWIDPSSLPRRYVSYSSCFRKEVGSHGRDTLGIFRIHQFEKVEQFTVTSPEEDASWKMFEEMISSSEEFYQSLKIPYRVVAIVSGELNNAAAKKLDLEAWFPGSQAFRELVSCSNCLDYQARRLEVRYGTSVKGKTAAGNKDKQYVHMLNSTLTATERTLCCILENYQEENGVRVPEVLVPYMHGIGFIPFVNKLPKQKGKADKGAAKKVAQGVADMAVKE